MAGSLSGIIICDALRRLVARNLVQQYATTIHTACAPHQFALSTRAGTEAVVRTISVASQSNPQHTVLSADGIGAYDTISRNSMQQGLRSTFGTTKLGNHIITQEEGGEQGDPLMPVLFSLGQRAALQAIQHQLHLDELLLAYLDDIHAVDPPTRIHEIYDLMAHKLNRHTQIQLNSGKARVWNASGTTPPNLAPLGHDVWVSDQTLPSQQQGLTILSTPLVSETYVRHQLNNINCSHEQLLQRIPARDDLQAFWFLLLFCASPRSNYILRTTAPAFTTEFAADHDVAVTSCLRQLLGQPPLTATALGRAHLPLALGGLGFLGLQSAAVLAPAAYWASTIHSSNVSILRPLSLSPASNPSRARGSRHTAGRRLEPSRRDLVDGALSPPTADTAIDGPTTRGWQQTAAHVTHASCRTQLLADLDPASQALLISQSGPRSSRAFATIPISPEFTYPSHIFRILLLRRLRLELPLAARTCRCRRALDLLGGHRAACAQSGVLRSGGGGGGHFNEQQLEYAGRRGPGYCNHALTPLILERSSSSTF